MDSIVPSSSGFDEEDTNSENSTNFHNRLDTEWTTLNAIREMLGISLKGTLSPTYKQALDFGKVIAPELFNTKTSLLGKEEEPALVQEYRQRADGLSQIRNVSIEPLTLLDEDIALSQNLIRTSGERDKIRRRLDMLTSIRSYFLPRPYTENELILRDVYTAEREVLSSPLTSARGRDYSLPNGRGLRIRLLHPDPPEHSMGADLIYEHYWEKRRVARLALVQYKIWHNRTLYLSQAANLEAQLQRLKSNFCDQELCTLQKESERERSYRLPYCLAFLRPTDKIQDPNGKLVSSGLHVPVCVINRLINSGEAESRKIQSNYIRSEAVTHKVFEEMLNANLLGSRWFTYDELEVLYKSHKLFQPNERITIHAQEFDM
jgi:hypothetical protein